MKWIEKFYRIFFFVVVFLGVFLVFKSLVTRNLEPTPIDVSGGDLEKYVSVKVNRHLDGAVESGIIEQFHQEPIHTPIDSFKVIAQKYAADGSTQHCTPT
jgi:hypothetical protein